MSQIDILHEPHPTPVNEARGSKTLYIVDKDRKINLGAIVIYPHLGSKDLEDSLMAILPGMNIGIKESGAAE